jgi:hypothetical protein
MTASDQASGFENETQGLRSNSSTLPRTSFSGVEIMHTYEKPPGSHNRGSNYTGLIAVTCLLASIFAIWAVTRTSFGVTTSPAATTVQNGKTQ